MKEKRFGKKQLVLGGMVLLLGGAIYLNYFLASSSSPFSASVSTSTNVTTQTTARTLGQTQFVGAPTAATEDYFAAARQSREDARQEALDVLEETLADVKTDSVGREEAVQAAATVAQSIEQENAVESMLKAKGFEDCVVYIENDQCHVAVKSASLDDTQTLRIVQVVTSLTTVSADQVSIVAVE